MRWRKRTLSIPCCVSSLMPRPIPINYKEHAEMKVLLFRLEHLALQGQAWSEDVRKLWELIGRHAQQEEETEFPLLRDALSQLKKTALAGKVEREKAMIL